jgi:O-acetyl-ADP-ribose deacetylase (regulator of RNase III)
MKLREIKGDLITLAKQGEFDVIVQGNNCFCTQGAGLAPQMVEAFGTDTFSLERSHEKGKINKLGTIDYEIYPLNKKGRGLLMEGKKTLQRGYFNRLNSFLDTPIKGVYIVNSYTQYGFGRNHENGTEAPVDYEAVTMVMRKINHIFKGKHIGLPWIGAGLAGGDWNRIRKIILSELTDCDVTLVEYSKK